MSSDRSDPPGSVHAEPLLAWEQEYRQKGRVWKGAPLALPTLPEGFRVLELGCGNGKTLSAMLDRPWKIVALDVSPRAVRLSSEIAQSGSSADLVVADASRLPFRGSSFDAVFAFHVTGHVREEERRQLALEASRVLREGGLLFFLGFGQNDMRAGKGAEVEPSTFRRSGGILTHYFSEKEVAGLFGMLRPVSIETKRRTTRIMGRDHLREEIWAKFAKGEIRDDLY